MAKTDLRLYEYVIICQPKVDSKGNTTEEGELVSKGELLSTDDEKALIKIHRAIPESYLDKLDRVVVAFRPF